MKKLGLAWSQGGCSSIQKKIIILIAKLSKVEKVAV